MRINQIFYTHLKSIRKLFMGIIPIILIILIKPVNSQDLVLQDMTISTTEFYSAENSITAGAGFTIGGNGEVTFKSGNYITLKPGFVVLEGGKLYALTGNSTDLNDNFDPELPNEFALMQNYPNPFNPSTTITYQLNKNGHVSLTIYDLLGKEVKKLVSEYQNRGEHRVTFDAENLVSGVYIYRLETGGATLTKKMVFMK